jgi:hypothetical protein
MKDLMEEFPYNLEDFVTIVDRKTYERVHENGPFETVTVTEHKDQRYWGDVLQIKVINSPYILLKHHSKYEHSHGKTVQLDLREVTLMKITDEYVKIALEKE